MAKNRGLYKRGRLYWIAYKGLSGETIRESTGTDDYRKALVKLNDRRAKVDSGQDPEEVKIPAYTLGELADRYKEFILARHRGGKHMQYIVEQLRNHFGPHMQMNRFTPAMIENLQADMTEKGYSVCTINKTVTLFRTMFKKGVSWGVCSDHVLSKLQRVKLLPGENRRDRYLSREEIDALLRACSVHLYPIVQGALLTGMRRGEILSLMWKDIDMKGGFIRLSQTKNGRTRYVPVCATLRDILNGLPSVFLGGYVFGEIVEENGKKTVIPFKEVRRSFASACRAAKIQGLHFHDLRHTAASHMIMNGIDVTTVAAILGHRLLSMTERYSHLSNEHIKKAAKRLDEALNGVASQSTSQLLHNAGV